jgi:hypothetical protein
MLNQGVHVAADELHKDESAQGAAVRAIVFERWRWVENGVAVRSDYCRRAWLPAIGPAAWLLWDSVTRRLEEEARVEWSVPEVARFHGIGCADVTAAVERLESYGLVVGLAPARWRVRMRCPVVLADTDEVVPLAPTTGTVQERRPQLWASRHRPIASRGAR